MSCHVMSCHVMSCHVMSCHVMSCHVMSCHVVSGDVGFNITLCSLMFVFNFALLDMTNNLLRA